MAGCATWPSFSSISSPRSPDSLDVAALRCRRVAPAQTSALDSQSLAGESAESSADRPSHCGPVRRLDAPFPPAALGHRAPACDDHGVPPRLGEAQVSTSDLFSPQRRGRPGPKGPAPELITAIVEMKRRNPRFGCRRIAQQLAFIFGVEIDKDVVRRVLAKHYRPEPSARGPSWLTFLGHSKDSLWSVDLFRCESLILRTHWVMVVMDQFTRTIVGFDVHAGLLDGPAICRMFNQAIAGEL